MPNHKNHIKLESRPSINNENHVIFINVGLQLIILNIFVCAVLKDDTLESIYIIVLM